MTKKSSLLSGLLQLITYQEKEKPEEFVIPEVEGSGRTGEEQDGRASEQDKKAAESEKKAADPDKKASEPEKKAAEPTEKKSGKSGIIRLVNPEEHKNAAPKENKKQNSEADLEHISTDIQTNSDFLRKMFNDPVNKDIVIRDFLTSGTYKSFIIYIDGMADKSVINDFMLRPLMTLKIDEQQQKGCILDYVHAAILEINQTKKVFDHKDAITEVLMGNSVLCIDGCDFYISCETKGFDKRNVGKPETEGVVKGPQQGFVENLKTNITLIRRIIKNNSLTTEYLKVGERSNTLIGIVYIKDIVNPAIIKEVKRRINGIHTDFVASAGMLEQLIEDNPYSIIPTILTTERPDRTASHLFEGKVAIFIDGTPFTIIVPVDLFSLIHSPEDAALKWQVSSAMRLMRFFAAGIATFLPGMYIAISTFHREMMPTDILIAIAKAKENVPFPSFFEIMMMEISFELIREAGIRIPGIIGNTIGIIGALILGQAAVEANLVNPVLIIVVAVTGLGNFAIPNFSLASSIRLLRFPFILAGAFLGFYGIALGVVILVGTLVSHKSFGVPYLAPISPKTHRSKDIIFRWPLWVQELRPDYVNPLDKRRQPEISRQWSFEDPDTEGGGRSDG